jgi:arsenate reductase
MKKEILFVCWHNSGRSQLAEVYFNTYNKNEQYEAFSAGTVIKWDGIINPKVVELLLLKWIDIHSQEKTYVPKNLDYKILMDAEKVFTMWCMEWWCVIGEREVDFDFWLDDPADDATDIEEMWIDFETKMKKVMKSIA